MSKGVDVPDLELATRIGWWDAEETLRRARLAADAMGLPVSAERPDGFKAGSQWTRAFELEVWVEGRWNGSDLTVHGRTMKVGFNRRLEAAARRFVDLVRDPEGSRTDEASNARSNAGAGGDDGFDWRSYLDNWDAPDNEEPETAQLPMAPAAAIFYGVVSGLITQGVLAGGKYVVRRALREDGSETDERPGQLYDPDTKQVWHRQADGSYQPSGQKID